MAGSLPDPHSLRTWEDAFQHPLPVVRKLEQQLRRNIDENRQKLRSLVGTSYRDLLGAAERIVEMDEQMQTVESHLGEIGERCDARVVERVGVSQGRMRRVRDAKHAENYAIIAQTKVLQSALAVVGRIVRAGGDALRAAKLLVLARLLHKSAVESPGAPRVLEDLRKRLKVLRKRLLTHIERILVTTSTDRAALADALGAYSLVTSSTPKEVLRHFLQVRFEKLNSNVESTDKVNVLAMLEIYSQSQLDVRELFPRRFAEVLSRLAKIPIFQDDQVSSVFELNLDIYEGWIPHDVRTFTPWVRHDQFASRDVIEALASWTKQAQVCLLQGLQNCLDGSRDAEAILDLRKEVLSKCISLHGKLRTENATVAVNAFQEIFMKRFKSLVRDLAGDVDIDVEVEGATGNSANLPQKDLWDQAISDFDFSNGAIVFRKAIVQSRHGRSKAVEQGVEKLDLSLQRVLTFWEATEAMRASRWNDALDFDLDDLEDGDKLEDSLTKLDPEELQNAIRNAIRDATENLYNRIKMASESSGNPAYLLRMLRAMNHRSHELERQLELSATPLGNQDLPYSLHTRLAEFVSNDPTNALLESFKQQQRVAVMLWDGSPPLPVQPSPGTIKFLTSLHGEMSNTGIDLWSPECVRRLKVVVDQRISEKLIDYNFDAYSNGTNGHVESDADGEESEDGKSHDASEPVTPKNAHALQRFMDMLYLQRVLKAPASKANSTPGLADLVTKMREKLDLDAAADERMRKSAGEYWKRTYLLFGLLASDIV